MDEGTTRVGQSTPGELEAEAEAIRWRIAELVSELDLRRRELVDGPLQFRRHYRAIAIGGLGFLLLFGARIGYVNRRRQLRARPLAKARRLRDALARMVAEPEKVARTSPSVGKKALAAAASGAAGVIAKKAAYRMTHRAHA